MSLVCEPARRTFNAVFAAGASGVYLGLQSYHFIGFFWLMHSAWDLVHHFYGNPIWPFLPTSSLGCFALDALIALWFLAGAPSLFPLLHRHQEARAIRVP